MSLTEKIAQLAKQQEAERKAQAWSVYRAACRTLADGGELTTADLLAAADAAGVVGRPLDQIEKDAALLAELPDLKEQVAALPTPAESAVAKLALVERIGRLVGEHYVHQHRPPLAPPGGRSAAEILGDLERANRELALFGLDETSLRIRLREVTTHLKKIGLDA